MSKIRSLSFLTLATVIGGALNYAVYPILIRHLSIEDFATFSVLSSLIMILGIPAGGFGYFILMLARNEGTKLKENRKYWMRSLFQYGVVYMLVSLALLFTLVPLLGIQSYWPLVLVALLSGRSLVSAFFTAVLQAREKFLLLSIIGIILAFTRLTTSLLVIPYPGIIVAIAALLMTAVVSASLFSYFGRQALVGLDSDISLGNRTEKMRSLQGSVMVIALITCMQGVDIIVMKYLFSNFDVALYAAVSVITKFALIVISLVETVYLPELLEYHKKERNKRNLFLLFSLSILGFLISYFLLPILGETFLAHLRPELAGSYFFFRYLGIAATALGFFIIFIKALALSLRTISIYILIMVCTLIGVTQAHTALDFSLYYMWSMVFLYGVVIVHTISR